MNISSWLNHFRRSIAGQLDALGQQHEAQVAMLHTITKGQEKIMATLADIKTAEQEQGDRLTALVALTDAIFAKVSTAPADDPTAQEILDMISAHKATIDETIARDTPADTGTPTG